MSDVIIPYRYLVLGNTAAFLASENGIARAREMVVETDTGGLKLGDGATVYNSRSYINPPAPSFRYVSDTGSTADSDPGAGLFKWDNATQSSATVLYFDDATTDTGTDLSTFFTSLIGKTGYIHLIDAGDSSKFQVWRWSTVTDGTGYFKFAVTLQASSASFSDNRVTIVLFMPGGSSGGGGGVGSQVGYAYTESSTSASTASTFPTDNTIPQNTEGAAYAALDTTITPTSATSLLEIEVTIPIISGNGTIQFIAALFRDSGADAIEAGMVTIDSANRIRQMVLRCVVTAGSVSTTTFKLRYGSSSGTVYFLRTGAASDYFGGVGKAQMTIKEIEQ